VASNHATALKEMPRLEALKGRETILVVDDIESVWRFARTALERLGYRVFVANDGKSALEILGARGRDIDLVLLDLSMPGMSGAEAGRKIGEKYPGIPICVMSGYNEEIAGRQFSSLMFSTDFIQKPFTQQQLASRLRAILDSVEWMEPARETGGGGMAHSSGE
jgi:CheY-like chemotaxis protein